MRGRYWHTKKTSRALLLFFIMENSNEECFTGHKAHARCFDRLSSSCIINEFMKVMSRCIERFHSRDQQPYWITETKESICIKLKFNSQRITLVHHHGRHFFLLEHKHGRRDVM